MNKTKKRPSAAYTLGGVVANAFVVILAVCVAALMLAGTAWAVARILPAVCGG